jgi:hypothetical protein
MAGTFGGESEGLAGKLPLDFGIVEEVGCPEVVWLAVAGFTKGTAAGATGCGDPDAIPLEETGLS